jgi:acetyl esterase
MVDKDAGDSEKGRPTPDHTDVAYGPHERNKLDLYLAKSNSPTPFVMHIHGGGFRGGNKSGARSSIINLCLESGISIAPINYRLSQHAPFPAAMHDGARALQFLRAHAEEYNLDPTRVGATGGSAGGGISLWLGFHDDLADPDSEDPVARQSTRLTCMAVINTQTSYDLRFIAKHIDREAQEHPALLDFFGLKSDEVDTPRAHKLFDEASPIDFVSKGDPPVFMFYSHLNKPITEETTQTEAIHHPKFGQLLKGRLDPLGIECIVRYGDDYAGATKDDKIINADPDIVAFFRKHFGLSQ